MMKMEKSKYKPFTRLLEIRKACGLSRQQLADKAHVSAMTINALETGLTNYHDAKLSTLLAICHALGCKLSALFPNDKTIA